MLVLLVLLSFVCFIFLFYCLFVLLLLLFSFFCRDGNMISVNTVDFRYYVVVAILVNLGKP